MGSLFPIHLPPPANIEICRDQMEIRLALMKLAASITHDLIMPERTNNFDTPSATWRPPRIFQNGLTGQYKSPNISRQIICILCNIFSADLDESAGEPRTVQTIKCRNQLRRWPAEPKNDLGYPFQAGALVRHEHIGHWWAAAAEDQRRSNPEVRHHLGGVWDARLGDRRQEIVLIGIEMDKAARLKACLTKPAPLL